MRFWLCILVLAGCSEKGLDQHNTETDGDGILAHEMIVLGEKLEDPYSVSNITKALASLYPTKAERVDIVPTDIYVRFLPKTDEEYQKLVDAGYNLMDHPLDYKIVKDGDYYHDPKVPEDKITWQYAVLPHGTKLPDDVGYEILDECFIPAVESDVKSDDGIDWDAVEREAFRLTGNEGMLVPQTKGGAYKPEGRITIVDDNANGGKPFGVAGVKVICNVFVKYANAYTDRDGYYKMSRKYSSRPRYRLRFKNSAGFAIGFNKILVTASTSALGKGSPEGKDITITKDSDRKLWCRSVVNNATYDYISRCGEEDMNIACPPKGLRIWIFQNLKASSAVMLKHGAIIDNMGSFTKYLGLYSALLKIFLPDITLGLSGKTSYAEIYSETCHELAHSSHFAQVGTKYWDKYIKYIVASYLMSGGVTYGDGTDSDAGYCEIGEMWGYYMQNAMYHDRYGGAMPTSGMKYWFHPQIFRYLEERGMTRSMLFAALKSDVTSKEELKTTLLALYPESATVIQQVFSRYMD